MNDIRGDDKVACEMCRFSHLTIIDGPDGEPDMEMLYCHRRAPSPGVAFDAWTPVKMDDWCGEFKPWREGDPL